MDANMRGECLRANFTGERCILEIHIVSSDAFIGCIDYRVILVLSVSKVAIEY